MRRKVNTFAVVLPRWIPSFFTFPSFLPQHLVLGFCTKHNALHTYLSIYLSIYAQHLISPSLLYFALVCLGKKDSV